MSGICLMRLANIVSDWLYMRPISIFGHCSDATFPIWIDGSTSCCCWLFFYFIFSSVFFGPIKRAAMWSSGAPLAKRGGIYTCIFYYLNSIIITTCYMFFSRARLIELNVSILVLGPGKYIPSNLVFVFFACLFILYRLVDIDRS